MNTRFKLLPWMSLLVLLLASVPGPLAARDKKATGRPVVRWQEGDPDCTLSTGSDGVYRYSLSYETISATLAVDSQELQITRRTLEHVFRVILTVRNRGTTPVYVQPQSMTLELVDHFHVQMRAEDPARWLLRSKTIPTNWSTRVRKS